MVRSSEDDDPLELSRLLDARYTPNQEQRVTVFEKWYPSGEREVLIYVASKVGMRIDDPFVEDFTQDAVFRAFRAVVRGQYRYKGVRFTAYVKTIALNQIRSFFRSLENKKILISIEALVQGEEELVDPDADLPEDILSQKEIRLAASWLMETISERQQMVLEHHYLDDQSYKEIADDHNDSEQAVRKLAFRTVNYLRNRAAKMGL